MSFLSLLKSLLLKGVDAANGRPAKFDRDFKPDPSATFADETSRRLAIEQFAELELRDFVSDGTFSCALPNDLGDAAIWQGVYTAMCVFRWKLYGGDGAHEAMVQAAKALSKYLHFGTLVRGAMPSFLEGRLFVVDPTKIRYYFTYDGYTFREDASLDSLVGIMFGIAAVKRFGDAKALEPIISPLGLFAQRFAADGFRLTNRDGSRTTYGDCAPGVIQAPVRIMAAALPSTLADRFEWEAIAKAYGPEFATPDTQVPGKMSWVNAHLAILATCAYIMGTDKGDPGRTQAFNGLASLVGKYADSGNAFLVAMALMIGDRPVGPDAYVKMNKTLGEFPLGGKLRAVVGEGSAAQPIPMWQRPPADVAWQRSPYTKGGATDQRLNRLDYLLAHFIQMVGA